ncbi:MAG: zinc ribbon domain-containing protein [Clostridia bacterium]|nr:zinc ribbon domain-containing protein [Clostridia bacterium]MDD4048520.1 zinc ribbon domain-containing protein [Clostridia bacterium]
MAFFNDFGKKIKGVAQSATKKSGEMVEITKLNLNINSEEESIKKLYAQIGDYCFKKFEIGTENDEVIISFCRKIETLNKNINSYKDKIREIKNVVICPTCGNETEKNNMFCGKCGAKVEIKEEVVKAVGKVVAAVKAEMSADVEAKGKTTKEDSKNI